MPGFPPSLAKIEPQIQYLNSAGNFLPALFDLYDKFGNESFAGSSPGQRAETGAYLNMALQFLGLRLREALLPVGVVFNPMELEIRRKGGKKKE